MASPSLYRLKAMPHTHELDKGLRSVILNLGH